MRRPQLRSAATLAAVLPALWLSIPQLATALPLEAVSAGYGYLMVRDCANPCGMDSQYCCGSGEQCFTSNGLAGCTAAAGGGFAIFTTTWTLTQTFTSTGSTYFPAATTQSPNDCVPPAGSGWISCGSICCASNQYCAQKNQCMANGAGGGGVIWTTSTYTSGGTVMTTQFSAPYRVTGSGTATSTTGAAATGTADNQTGEDGAGGGGGGLTAGQIAGIVIGVLAAVVLLIVLCACCIVRGLCIGLMSLLGLGKKKETHRSEKTTVEERYVRRGASRGTSTHSRRDRHSGWFSGSGRPSTVASRKEKKDSGAGWLGLAGAAGTILLLLGLKRGDKKKTQQKQVVEERRRSTRRPRSEHSAFTLTDSYTSYSGPSSAGTRMTSRTRDTRRTRRTESRSRAASRR